MGRTVWALSVSLCIVLMGCTSLPKDSKQDTPRDLLKRIAVEEVSGPLSYSEVALGEAKTFRGFKTFSLVWSAYDLHGFKSAGDHASSLIFQHCAARGLQYFRDACLNASGEPLFLIKITPGFGRRTFGTLYEPTISEADSGYLDALRMAGFTSKADEKSARMAREYYAEMTKRRKDRERSQKFSRGTKVCQVSSRLEDSTTLVGYVEDWQDERIKISIADAFFTNARGMRPGGFQPHVEWAHVDAWDLCN